MRATEIDSDIIELPSEDQSETIVIDAYCKKEPLPVFSFPIHNVWGDDSSYVEGYYFGSKALVEGVISGFLDERFEGVAGLFLFRHYLELELKYIIFHARWMKDWFNNSRDYEVQGVGKSHSLLGLWEEAQRECKQRIPSEIWSGIDLGFVEDFIKQLHGLDPKGETFRYPTDQVRVGSDSRNPLNICFQSLHSAMEHIHSVLDWIDMYLTERYHENAEWESIQDSF